MELVIQAIIFFITFVLLFKRDRFCALFYFIAYLYMLPDEVCCGYVPFLLPISSVESIYIPFYVFSTFSIFLFWFVLYINVKKKKEPINCIRATNSNEKKKREGLVYAFIVVLLSIQLLLIYLSYADISYHNLASVEYKNSHPQLRLVATLYGLSNPLIFLLLLKFRSLKKGKGAFCGTLLLWAVVQNFYYGTLAGSRSGLLAIIIGVLFVFYGNKKVSLSFLLKIGVVVIVVAIIFSNIRFARSGGTEEDSQKEYVLLQQDYIGPEINTIAAIMYNIIDPMELLTSNFVKIFPFNDYPYLYMKMAEIFDPGSSDASAGYGFYLFTEGYLFAGQAGFLYNGIWIALLLLMWRRIGRTNDTKFNIFIMAVMISFFFAMVRSQSSLFFRNIWSQLLPMVFLYSWFMGVTVNYKKLFLNLK